MIDWNPISEHLIQICLSMVCGFVLGFERKSRSQAVGIRTLVLICMSSTLLSILSTEMTVDAPSNSDATRIAAGVVSGIGFLGGGVIMRQGMNIKGLTSAAVIWTASALGLSIGAGLYVQSGVVLVGSEVILVLIEKVQLKKFPSIKTKMLHLVFEESSIDLDVLGMEIEKAGLVICDVNMSRIIAAHQLHLHYSVKVPRTQDYNKLLSALGKLGPLTEFSLTD